MNGYSELFLLKGRTAQLESVPCVFCGQDCGILLYSICNKQTGEGDRFDQVRCKSCGLVYLNPRPRPSEIGKYYPAQSYYSYQEVDRGRLRESIKTLMRESMPGYSTGRPFWRRWVGTLLRFVFSDFVDILVPFVPGGKILDVGCGNGTLIGWMKSFGWQTFGVEISPQACALARKKGIEVSCGHLKEIGYPPAMFDVIILNHVLEHLHDPVSVIEECRRLLKPSGLLIVDSPNFDCYDARIFQKYWENLCVPTHLYQFTIDTLTQILERCGFRVERKKYKPLLRLNHSKSLKQLCDDTDQKRRSILEVFWKVYVERVIQYIFSRKRGELFSENMTVYSRLK